MSDYMEIGSKSKILERKMVKKRQEREMRKRSLMFALCFARCHMAHSQVALIAVF